MVKCAKHDTGTILHWKESEFRTLWKSAQNSCDLNDADGLKCVRMLEVKLS